MKNCMQAISEELDQHWELIGRITSQNEREVLVEELEIASVRVHKEASVS